MAERKHIRSDSWSSVLTDEQGWQLYYKAEKPGPWTEIVAWARKEFGVEIETSMSSFYAWKRKMRSMEHEHHMREAAIASAEAAALGLNVTKDEALIAAFKQLAVEASLNMKDPHCANEFIKSAVALQDRILRKREIDLKELGQQTREKSLALLREKFEAAEKRLNAVKETVKNPELTPEKLKEELDRMFGREED